MKSFYSFVRNLSYTVRFVSNALIKSLNSSLCLFFRLPHGRVEYFDGKYFDNIFVHYQLRKEEDHSDYF